MKKLSAALLTVAAAALVLTGCGSKGSGANEIKFGTNAEFPPFEFVTASGVIGEYDGIDMAIAKQIGEETGKEIKIAASVAPKFKAGKALKEAVNGKKK